MALAPVLPGCGTMETLGKESHGTFQSVQVPNKDFETVGLVFTEATFETDSKGRRGDVFIYNALLKEAQKLGGHYIINIVIDIKKKGNFMRSPLSGVVEGKETETWYGSAVAIKFTTSIKNKGTTTVVAPGGTTTTTIEEYSMGENGSASSYGQ